MTYTPSSIQYTQISVNGHSSLTAFVASELLTITDSHPAFAEVSALLASGDADEERIYELMSQSTSEVVADQLRRLTDHVSYDGTDILFDGKPMHGTIVEVIKESLKAQSSNWKPLTLFLERLANNPSMTSRRELFDWLEAEGLTIAPDGRIVGYKGLTHDAKSVHGGGAFVNGTWVDGQVPNALGSVISLDRSQVDDDRDSACSFGLHVGSYDYAQGFARGTVATVLVDPADVVSVPSDCDAQKMRTCRYEIVRLEQQSATYLGRAGVVSARDLGLADDEDDFDDEDDEYSFHDFSE